MFKSTHVRQIFRNILGVTAAIYAAITFFLVVIPVVRYFSVARPEFTGSTSKGEIHEHKPFHGGVEIILDNGESYNFYFYKIPPPIGASFEKVKNSFLYLVNGDNYLSKKELMALIWFPFPFYLFLTVIFIALIFQFVYFYFLGDSPLFVAHWPGEEITMKIPRALSVLGLIPFNLAALLNILWYLDPERWMQ